MLDSSHRNWRKLDNAALAFPAATGKHDTRVFRFYCLLKETVDPEILQRALDETMKKYPLYQAVLRKGLFWFYLEQRDIQPTVRQEERLPCSGLYIPDKKSLLFEVSYDDCRINLEVFHALTDGTGAMNFIKELVVQYLRLAHPEAELPPLPQDEAVTRSDQEEDSFSLYYSQDYPKTGEKKEVAACIPGGKVSQDEMRITEVILPVDQMLACARSHGVSLTVYLTAVLLCAIREELPDSKLKKPVSLMVPVNLRNYFPSDSMTNFFGWIEVGYHFQRDTTFEQVLEDVKRQFKTELVKERIGRRMSELVSLEKNPILRAVPLEIKQWFLLAGTTLGGRSMTAIYSNVGVIRLPEPYEKYIDRFGVFTSTGSFQLCSCSFGNQLALGFTSKYKSSNIQRNFLNILKEHELPYEEVKNDFPGEHNQQAKTGKTMFRIFTFLCIALSVLSLVTNYGVSRDFMWGGVTTAVCLCAWLIAVVGYKKRRNPLKNSMWQLLIISVLSVLWDRYTGWHGWSVDFVIPLASLAVMCSVVLITRFQHLEEQEYLFYLAQASAFGLIPWLLLVVGVVRVPYPSLVCGGICFLSFAWMFLFKGKSLLQEIQKKFRI